MKKTIALFLSLIFLILVLSSCNEAEKNSENALSENSQFENLPSDIEVMPVPISGEISYEQTKKKDLGGRTFNIIERYFGHNKESIHYSGEVLYMENKDGVLDSVNKTKKEIIEQIEKDYNCKIEGEIFGEGSSNIVKDLKNVLENDIVSKTYKYDFFFETPYYYTDFIVNGYIKDVNEISAINLKSSCWDEKILEGVSICESLYFLTGAINCFDNDGTIVMYMNKDLYEKNGYIEDVYSLVRDKKWTYDKFFEMASQFEVSDINKDGERNEFDNWFLGSESSNLYVHVVSSGETIVKKDKEDVPFVQNPSDLFVDAYKKYYDLYKGGNVLVADLQEYYNKYPNPGEIYEKTVNRAFMEERMLFHMTTLIQPSLYNSLDFDIAVLPVPMYNETQGGYISYTSPHTFSSLMIINSPKADDDLGIMIQALCELSEEKLKEPYYEQLLGKNFNGENVEMLDIVFDSRAYDFASVFGSMSGANRLLEHIQNFNNPVYCGPDPWLIASHTLELYVEKIKDMRKKDFQ
ncbi:MAG: hypothetical protein E7614_01010 [Ruminococcaceae bacterium]|nr:hypothetical protein [Oscillospiraceae bacterium]